MSRYWHRRRHVSQNPEDIVLLLLVALFAAIFYPPVRPIIASFWYIYALAGLIVGVIVGNKMYYQYKLSKAGISEIDKMSGADFETYLNVLFSKLGYSVQHTGKIGDYGSDLVITKNGIRTAVQAKRYESHVGPDAVREVYTVLKIRNCANGMVVTNSYYTEEAKTLAKVNNITLWNRDDLVKAILRVKSATTQ